MIIFKKSIILITLFFSYMIFKSVMFYEIKKNISEKKVRCFLEYYMKIFINILYILNLHYFFGANIAIILFIITINYKRYILYNIHQEKEIKKEIKKEIYYYYY